MGRVDHDVLEARVRGLDSGGLAAFVADLWAARGFETARHGAVVTARRREETQVVYVLTGGAGTPAVETPRSVDVVVAAGRPRAGETLAAESNARFVDAAGLTGMLRYAIERDVATTLCKRHFGAAPAALTFPPRDRVRRAVAGLDVGTVVTALLAMVVVAVGANAVVGLVGPGVAGGGPSDGAAVTPGTVTSPGGDGPRTVTVNAESVPTDSGASTSAVAPGVSETGLDNASRLAAAHAAAVSGSSSYTIWFDYYAPENGSTERVQYDVDVRVDGERVSVRTSREPAGGTRSLLSTVYFEGTDRYSVNSSGDRTRLDSRPPTATPRAVPFTRPGRMVRLYLATAESTVRTTGTDASETRYRLRGTGRPAGLPDTVRDYEMTAIVDERGFVRTFEAEFSIPRDGGADGVGDRKRVRLTWTYDRVNRTAV